MTPFEIYSKVLSFAGKQTNTICDLHSACSPKKGKTFLCGYSSSATPVIDFDEVKVLADKTIGVESRKSVDALALTPSLSFLCFIELKSWELLISYGGTERKIRRQAAKYSSDLTLKLSDSIRICEEITDGVEAFSNCDILYILLTNISVEEDGITALNSDLSALAGTSSNLKELCNSLSKGAMDGIPAVQTRYWECRNFDKNISTL